MKELEFFKVMEVPGVETTIFIAKRNSPDNQRVPPS